MIQWLYLTSTLLLHGSSFISGGLSLCCGVVGRVAGVEYINQIASMLSRCVSRFGFSAEQAVAQKTFLKFNERYSANLEDFRKKVSATNNQAEAVRRSTQRAYVHPLHTAYKPTFPSVSATVTTSNELRGPEQVSPHYQHFSFARRQALIFLGGLVALRFIANTEDFFMFAQTGTWAWTFYFGYNYIWLEGKKYFLLPFLHRFYRKLLSLEMTNVETYWAENTEARVRNLMSVAKEQIEFKCVHREYLSVRNNSLLNFMIAEQLALKNHLHSRAENILREVQSLEVINQNKIISNVMQEVLQSIDLAYKNNKQKIEADIFELALEGIANGRMDYQKDPILPFIIETINKTVAKFSSLSKEEQEKLVALTAEQLTAVRNADVRARDEYILTEPKIDGSLRNNPTVAKLLQTWGK